MQNFIITSSVVTIIFLLCFAGLSVGLIRGKKIKGGCGCGSKSNSKKKDCETGECSKSQC